MQDFLDARRAVEGGLAYLAAKRATSEDEERLLRMVEGMKEAVESSDDARFEELDVAFHRLIAEMSQSEILQYLGSTLFETLEDFIRIVPHTPKGWQRHDEVCAAIRSHDPDRSQRAMHDLVDATAAYIHFVQSHEDGN